MFHATGLTGWQRAAAAETDPSETPEPSVDPAAQALETEITAMQSQLDAMKKRLAEMGAPQE